MNGFNIDHVQNEQKKKVKEQTTRYLSLNKANGTHTHKRIGTGSAARMPISQMPVPCTSIQYETNDNAYLYYIVLCENQQPFHFTLNAVAAARTYYIV